MTASLAGMTTADFDPAPTDAPARAPARARALTPDLARGLALLGIATVNARLLSPQDVVGTADRVSTVLVTGLLENRSWPMFAVMFGFGIAAIAARLDRQGGDRRARNRVLRRRCWWLVALGLAQVVLVFWGDILGVYGLTGLVVVALLDRSARTQVCWASAGATLWLVGTVAINLGPTSDEVPDSTSYWVSIGERLEVFVFWTSANSLLLTHLAPMLVGVALYRLGALARPGEHLRLHARLATAGLVVGLAGAVPACLVEGGLWAVTQEVRAGALGLHAVTGLAQGVGYVSLVALWSARRAHEPPRPGLVAVVTAIGSRSLTVYLVHSILLGLALSAWALDLGGHLSVATTYLLGLGVWGGCACVALVLAALGRRGPADAALRRLSYGSSPTPGDTDVR